MTNSPDRSSAGNGDAQIQRAAQETAPSAQVVRSDGDLLVYYAGFNLSKFVRFLALQPHVAPTDAQAVSEPSEEDVAIALFVARHRGLTNIMPWDDIDHDGRDYWRTIARNLMRTHRVVPVSRSSADREQSEHLAPGGFCRHCGLQGGHDRMCQMASTFGDTEADREEKEDAQRLHMRQSADRGALERTVRHYIESAVLWIPREGVRGSNGLDATDTINLLCKRMVAALTPTEPQGAPEQIEKRYSAIAARKLAAALEHSADHDSPEGQRKVMFSVARSLYSGQGDPQTKQVSAEQAHEDARRERAAASERKRYESMSTAEKCAVQPDGFINDYD